MSEFEQRLQAKIANQNRQAAARPTIVAGGGGPHDPDMEPRVAALEAQAKDTAQSLHRIEVALAGLMPILTALPTKADVATSTGALNTLKETVAGLDKRMGAAEAAITDTIKTAVGKSIGPLQLPVIIVATATALGLLATGYHWLTVQPWFPR